jgi:hypothetical protein
MPPKSNAPKRKADALPGDAPNAKRQGLFLLTQLLLYFILSL